MHKNPHSVSLFILAAFLSFHAVCMSQPANCTPGWNGDIIIDCESKSNWSVEHDAPSSGALALIDGVQGKALRLDWDLSDGDWVQAKYTFPQPVDLSRYDILGLSLRGGADVGNRVSIMLADTRGVFYGVDCDDINLISRWMINLSFPKKMFYHFFTIPDNGQGHEIDWSRINRFFVVIKRPGAFGGGAGHLSIDHVQVDRAADWPRQEDFETVTPNEAAVKRAVRYISSQQKSTGLFVSWKQEPTPKAWLYDQALALIVMTRQGLWLDGTPQNEAASKAQRLARFLISRQKSDGRWARAWNADSGAEIADDKWVGDQAWCVIALSEYADAAGDNNARQSADIAGAWLADKVQADGFVVASTEGTVDAWWAMIATGRFDKADRIENRLLTTLWDAELRYWLRGYGDYPDPVIAMDAATWVGEFARSSRVNREDMALAALSFVRRTLVATDSSGEVCGFDGQGPVSIWCEGTAQYISAGGEDAQKYLDMLLTLQRDDGGMPGSPEDWPSTCFGWLTSWTGLSSTAWLYFALTRSPFDDIIPTIVNDYNTLPQRFVLKQNAPNPFNRSTMIRYELAKKSFVELAIYNIKGERIRTLVDKRQSGGRYVVRWDGLDDFGAPSPSGVYFYRLQSEHFGKVEKMLLAK